MQLQIHAFCISFLSNIWHKCVSIGCICTIIFIVLKTSTLNHSFFFLFFFSIENQQKTNNELGEMKGIFYQNPVIIVFIFAVAVLVPRMSWQPHSSMSLCYCTLLGCHYALVSFCCSKVCCFVHKQDRSISLLDE